jgi:hypothetical protein
MVCDSDAKFCAVRGANPRCAHAKALAYARRALRKFLEAHAPCTLWAPVPTLMARAYTVPSGVPSPVPSSIPSASPTSEPSSAPTTLPSSAPTSLPSAEPSSAPTAGEPCARVLRRRRARARHTRPPAHARPPHVTTPARTAVRPLCMSLRAPAQFQALRQPRLQRQCRRQRRQPRPPPHPLRARRGVRCRAMLRAACRSELNRRPRLRMRTSQPLFFSAARLSQRPLWMVSTTGPDCCATRTACACARTSCGSRAPLT